MMFDLSIFEDQTQDVSNVYDNQGAYNQLQMMMKSGDILRVKFYTSQQDNTPCAWIESKTVAGFRYILKDEALQGLMRYLAKGVVTDFDTNPSTFEAMPEETPDYGELIMKALVEAGKTIQWIPLFREKLDKVSGIVPCKKGKIFIRVNRNETILDYLREHKQIA